MVEACTVCGSNIEFTNVRVDLDIMCNNCFSEFLVTEYRDSDTGKLIRNLELLEE